jgi:hypothetical protein
MASASRGICRPSADAAAVGRGQAQAHADGGGLAGAVRADHAQAFAGRDLERQVVDHGGVAVALAQVAGVEQGWGGGAVQQSRQKDMSAEVQAIVGPLLDYDYRAEAALALTPRWPSPARFR